MTTDQHLRDLLRAGRTASGNISQEEAARRAGFKIAYWQRIESGRHPAAPADTLAAMLFAVGITSARVRDIGCTVVADNLEELEKSARPAVSPEAHLAATPGATEYEIGLLQALWRALQQGDRTTDPIEELEKRKPRNDDLHIASVANTPGNQIATL